MAIYYIDTKGGKETNDGLSELTPVSDYKQLKIKPGDTVLFKRGSFIRGKLATVEGEKGKPVTYGAYGEGEMPVFCGSVNLSDGSFWKEEKENIWVCDSIENDEAASFIFNGRESFGVLRWTKEELVEQGDFFDTCFGFGTEKKAYKNHKIYLYSKKNPGEFYKDIECVVYGERVLADNGKNIVFKNLRFINSGVHAIAGERTVENMRVENCSFECIGGAVWSYEKKIRLGNAVEMWNVGNDVTVSGCYFEDIYDSAVTQQGDDTCTQANNFIITDNVFVKCGMGAYEQRDRIPLFAEFNRNICIDAGDGFSKLGEEMPRYSEIWPEPMGHHIFLWRIGKEVKGHLEIKNNVFYNAPYGAAVYSIIDKSAEALTILEGNTYYTENKELLVRWNGVNYADFEQYSEKGAVYEKPDINKLLEDWKRVNMN